MLKKTMFIALLSLSALAQAENQFSLGLGTSYGGFLGGKYIINYEGFKIYSGLGLLGYSSNTGSALGYNIGFDYQINTTSHAIGFSYGTVTTSDINGEHYTYIGPAINYAYYFSGFDKKSWLLGLSAFKGKRDVPNAFFEENTTGTLINIGYQF